MAKLKLLKYPKKPKQSASLATLENYLEKIKQVDKENATRKSLNAKRDSLAKRIASIGKAGSRKVSAAPKRRKVKKTTTKKKSTTRRKKR